MGIVAAIFGAVLIQSLLTAPVHARGAPTSVHGTPSTTTGSRGAGSVKPSVTTTTVATMVSSYRGALTQSQVTALVSRYKDWPEVTMVRVAFCESTFRGGVWNPVSVSGLHSIGLLGVLGGSKDPATNVTQAHHKWLTEGIGAWTASKDCWRR